MYCKIFLQIVKRFFHKNFLNPSKNIKNRFTKAKKQKKKKTIQMLQKCVKNDIIGIIIFFMKVSKIILIIVVALSLIF